MFVFPGRTLDLHSLHRNNNKMASRTIQEAYDKAEALFMARNPRSQAIYETATQSLPGGNTRTSVFYRPFPVAISRAEGAKLYDEDGHEYVDLLGEFTAGLYGHSEPVIMDAISKALHRGVSYGSQHEGEGKLAALVRYRFPSIDLLRFCNSGQSLGRLQSRFSCHSS